MVAHEAAHQWWANILTPGRGPGGNMLSEGMSHYATILLHEEEYGDRYRIEFAKRIEDSYGDGPGSWTASGHWSRPTVRATVTAGSSTTGAAG